MGKLFGTDGVRGEANRDPMTPETALALGGAVAYVLRKGGHRNRLVVGKDTRLSGYLFETAIAAGITSMGADVMLVGPLPTPGISFITQSMRADAGVVISASHNPYYDNGIKIFGHDGFKLPDEVEERIEAMVQNGGLAEHRPHASRIGRAVRIEDAAGRYIVFLKNLFPKDLTLEGVRIVVDCAHGAAYRVAPAVFEELGARVYPLAVSPDGMNINDGCGALHPEQMSRTVVRYRAQLGIALDGDADRVIICDEKGRIVDGDHIMAICARDLLEQSKLTRKTLVATVMSNIGLELFMASLGGKLKRTVVGDRYVVEEMRAGNFCLGGEQSGHIIFLEHATTGDGVIAALQLLAVMLRTGLPLSELAACMTSYPQTMLNIKVRERRPLAEMPSVAQAIGRLEKKLGRDGRVLVRYSGTEPKLRVMVEGRNQRTIEAGAQAIAEAIKKEIGE